MSYASRMAQPPRTLADLYRDLHRTEAELMACRPGRIGSRWWDRRITRRRRLRMQIDGLVRRRALTRRWWAPVL